MNYYPGRNELFPWLDWFIYDLLASSNELFPGQEWIIPQVTMNYFPGGNNSPGHNELIPWQEWIIP